MVRISSFKGKHHTAEAKMKNRLAHLKGKFIPCLICQKEFWLFPSAEKRGRKTCSQPCRGIFLHQTRSRKIEHKCIICSKIFYVKASKKRVKFCSKICHTKSMITRITKKCSVCQTEFEITQSANKYVKTCSIQCGITLKSGANCYMWKGGASFLPYSSEFNRQLKHRIRLRDHYICQGCGVSEGNLKRKHVLDIHHINHDKMNCTKENLISLCTSCNAKANFKRDFWRSLYSTKASLANVLVYS